MSGYNRAFTIVELLIVIVVIGVLAAITVVAYNGIQGRANDNAVQSDLSAFMKALEAFKITGTSARYPIGPSDLDLVSNIAPLKPSRSAYVTGTTSNLGYCVSADELDVGFVARSSTGNMFYITSKTRSVKPYTGPWDSVVRTACRDTSVLGAAADGMWAYNGTTQVWATWIK